MSSSLRNTWNDNSQRAVNLPCDLALMSDRIGVAALVMMSAQVSGDHVRTHLDWNKGGHHEVTQQANHEL
jgi:hypothetical protein